jgi:hypothetical protein
MWAVPERHVGRPPARQLHAHAGVGLDVAHPVGVASALGKQPERLAVQPFTDGRKLRLSGAPLGGLEQGVSGIRDSDAEGEPHERVHDGRLQPMDAAPPAEVTEQSGHVTRIASAVDMTMRTDDQVVASSYRAPSRAKSERGCRKCRARGSDRLDQP